MTRKQKPAVEAASRPTLRARTAVQRPVESEAPKRKRRTAEEMKKDKELKEAEQADQRRQLQENLERIAAMEQEIEANDANAHAVAMGPTRPVRRSFAFRVEPPEKSQNRLPSEEASSVPDDDGDETDTDTQIGKGKQKKAKPSIRASIRAIRQQPPAPEPAIQDSEDEEVMVASDVNINNTLHNNNSSQTRASRNQVPGEAPNPYFSTKDLDANVKQWKASLINASAASYSTGSRSSIGSRSTGFARSGRSFGGQTATSTYTSITSRKSAADVKPAVNPNLNTIDSESDTTPKATKVLDIEGIMATPGGLEEDDENDSEERKAAIASPPKIGKRLTSAAIVSIAETPVKSAKQKSYVNSNGIKAGEKSTKMGVSTSQATKYPSNKRSASSEGQADASIAIKAGSANTNERQTGSGIVKVETADVIEFENLEEPPKKRTKSSGKSVAKLKNSDLPAGATDNNLYRRRFITTYVRFAGCYDKCWCILEQDIVDAAQHIWDKIYGDRILYTIKTHDAVFSTATQRLYEWRSGFGSSAIAIVETFFSSPLNKNYFDSFEARREFAGEQLAGLRCLYAEVDENGQKKGVLRSTWVLQTMAHHQTFIDQSIAIPQLVKYKHPKAALALAAAAVERVFTLWHTDQFVVKLDNLGRKVIKFREVVNPETGKSSTKHTEFGEANWGSATQSYLRSINSLPEATVNDIIQEIQTFVNIKKGGASNDSVGENMLDEYDERANLLDV